MPRSPTSLRSRLLSALDRSPSGRTTTSLAREVGSEARRVATRLAEMQSDGRVIGVVPEVASGRRTKLWFAPQYAQQAATAGPVGWARSEVARRPQPSRATRAVTRPSGPVIIGADVRRVTAPSRRDMRYTVEPDEVRPFFSALRPGEYAIASGSCVARAYGEPSA